jgi:hypothetical protein
LLSQPDQITVKSGDIFTLRASGSTDPDNDNLSYLWIQYPEAGTYKEPLRFSQVENIYRVIITAPEVEKKETVHFILKVTDKGDPPLTRYKRVIVNIMPE